MQWRDGVGCTLKLLYPVWKAFCPGSIFWKAQPVVSLFYEPECCGEKSGLLNYAAICTQVCFGGALSWARLLCVNTGLIPWRWGYIQLRVNIGLIPWRWGYIYSESQQSLFILYFCELLQTFCDIPFPIEYWNMYFSLHGHIFQEG